MSMDNEFTYSLSIDIQTMSGDLSSSLNTTVNVKQELSQI